MQVPGAGMQRGKPGVAPACRSTGADRDGLHAALDTLLHMTRGISGVLAASIGAPRPCQGSGACLPQHGVNAKGVGQVMDAALCEGCRGACAAFLLGPQINRRGVAAAPLHARAGQGMDGHSTFDHVCLSCSAARRGVTAEKGCLLGTQAQWHSVQTAPRSMPLPFVCHVIV